MIQILRLHGTDKKLYSLVAPLVMNPDVLKQNYNFPFRTSEKFVWFVAVKNRKVVGFVPVECRMYEGIINNYYVQDKSADVLKQLLEAVIENMNAEKELTAVSFMDDKDVFAQLDFLEIKSWTRYVKMWKDKQ